MRPPRELRGERRRRGRLEFRGRGLRGDRRGPGGLRRLRLPSLEERHEARRDRSEGHDMSSAGTSPAAAKPRKTKWFALGALGVAAGAFLFITFGGIGENLVYYWGPKELRAAGRKAVGATIRLGGQVAPGSVKLGDGVSNLEFDVTDGT